MGLKEIWWDGVDWINPVPQIDPMAGCCENGDELSGSIKYGEFIGWLRNCNFLKKDSALWSQLVTF